MNLSCFSIAFLLISGTLIGFSYGDSVKTTQEVVHIGLDLTKTSIKSGDFESAKKYSKFTSDYFGKQVQSLRAINSQKADDIHIELLDIHTQINSDSNDVLSKINDIQDTVNEIQAVDVSYKNVIVDILSIADMQYQNSVVHNEATSYLISKSLVYRSNQLFDEEINFDTRLTLEINSFFDDLINQVDSNSDFVKVGNLVTAIQKDLLGTESPTMDQKNLYTKIRQLYDELLISVDSNSYDTAEEKAIEAYLDNFEYLEPEIEKVDQELLYSLEINMREELRNMIKSNKSPQDIRQFIDDVILPDLNKAESLAMEQLLLNPSMLPNADATLEKDIKEIGDATNEQKSGVRAEIDFIRDTLQDMLIYYENGDYQSAYASARTAYLDSYEFVEIPLREISPDFTLEVEFQFAELRNLINERADIEQVREVTIAIKRNLDESERLVSGTGLLAPSIAFSSSFALIFREGLESVLILGAILTYLEASRNTRFKPYVYYGIIAAIGATGVTWFITSYIIEISGASRELIEAIAALSATAVLFYVSFWILNKIEHKKWMEFVKAKVWQATTTGGVMVFVMLSFFTVYREGFETVLFYQAMFGFAKYMEVFVGMGFILGIVSLLGIYYLMRRLGRKLPLRILFGLTMGIGAYLSIAFLGNAVRELQILDIVPYTSMLGIIPRLDINLATMTGIYPTMETLVAQIILLGVYLLASSYVLIMRPNKEKQIAAMRKSRGSENAKTR